MADGGLPWRNVPGTGYDFWLSAPLDQGFESLAGVRRRVRRKGVGGIVSVPVPWRNTVGIVSNIVVGCSRPFKVQYCGSSLPVPRQRFIRQCLEGLRNSKVGHKVRRVIADSITSPST
jgi:hypothetical protein